MKASLANKRERIRKRAEESLEQQQERLERLSKADIKNVVHELGVHQIELETQNEELRQAQEERDTMLRRYTELYEFSPAAYFSLDRNGLITRLNQTAARMLGREKSRLLRKPIALFLPHLRDRARFREELREARTTGARRGFDVTLGGRDRRTDVHVQLMVPEFEAGTQCCSAVMMDITERVRLEQAARRSEDRYRILFDRSPLPTWVVDVENFSILNVNEAAVKHYGYSREEFRTLTLADIRTPDEFGKFGAWVRETRISGNRLDGQIRTRHRKKNGEIIDAEVRYAEIAYDERKAVLVIITDVTELRRTEAELKRTVEVVERSNRELQQFAYVASHDLQEPLRTVASYVELLAMKYRGRLDEKADKYISFAVEGVNRMSALINDLLSYSRVGTRGKPFSRVSMARVLEIALGNLRESIRESGAEVTSDELPEVPGDADQLVQLLQNLIANAVKFRKEGVQPRIHVSSERKEDAWEIGIHDNGIGIEPRFFERIFVIFQRLHTREEYPGTGVGLAISKRIVERHGGRIRVESNPGQGSGFYFTLPVEQPAAGHEEDRDDGRSL